MVTTVRPGSTAEMVDGIASTMLSSVERMLREYGMVLPPTVHAFIDDLPHRYAGYARSREFYRGGDAMSAVARLGAFPASIVADRVLVCWENADLRTAFYGESQYATGVAMLDADMDGSQVLRWHPYVARLGPVAADGGPTVIPVWGPAERVREPRLPSAVRMLLEAWRVHAVDHPFDETVDALEAEGFGVRFAQ